MSIPRRSTFITARRLAIVGAGALAGLALVWFAPGQRPAAQSAEKRGPTANRADAAGATTTSAAKTGRESLSASAAYEVYNLKQAQAIEAESLLINVLADLDDRSEVAADPQQNRVLVRGSAKVQQVARRVVMWLEKPSNRPQPHLALASATAAPTDPPAAERPSTSPPRRLATPPDATPTIPAAVPAVTAVRATNRHAERRAVASESADDRRPLRHPVRLAQAVDEAPPAPVAAGPRVIQLQNLSPADLEHSLTNLFGRQLPMTTERRGPRSLYTIENRAGGKVALTIDHETRSVSIDGAPALVGGWSRIVSALDTRRQPQDPDTRVVPLGQARPSTVRALITAFQNGARANARQPDGDEQPPRQDERQPDQAGVEQPNAQRPESGSMGGLIGPVQIEYLEGLDMLVLRGHPADVERINQIIEEIGQMVGVTEPEIVIHPLKHVGSSVLATLVQQVYEQVLLSRQGRVSMTPLVKPNALLLIGRKESVQAVTDLIERLDQPVNPNSTFQAYSLKHTPAAQAQTTVTDFFASRTGLGPVIKATADVRSNSLIVWASPRDLVEVAALIRRIDVSTSSAENELRVFHLRNSLADDLAPILQNAINLQGAQRQGQQQQQQFPFFQQQAQPTTPGTGASAQQQQKSTMLKFVVVDPDGERGIRSGILTEVRITADPRANALLVSAPADSMDLIDALIRQLDQPPQAEAQIKVFTIVNGDAEGMTQMLQGLFGSQQQQGGALNQILAGQVVGGASGENPLVSLKFSADRRTNSIIVSGSTPDLAVVEALLFRLDDSDVNKRKSTVYRLKNAPATEVSNAINQYLQSERQVQQIGGTGLVSAFEQIEREVVVVPEPVSNSLIVSATPRFFEEIKRLVEQLDARPPMVMIQVLIAQVSLNNTDEWGVELGLQDSILFDRSLLGDLQTVTTTATNAVTSITNQNLVAASNTPGFNFNNQQLGNSGSSNALANSNNVGAQGLSHFSLGRTNNELGFGGFVFSASSESVSVLIRALKESRRLDVLSRPQIMTLDNQPAFVQVGARVPRISGVQTNTAGQSNSIQMENVGVILGVTPRISPDNLVVMEIDAEKSELGPEAEGIPISISANGQVIRSPQINTTTAQTTVSAVSGQTIVLGGLITKSRSQVHRRVPLLSDLPVLGQLFRYDAYKSERTELLIIMTPHIVRRERDAEIIKQVEAARMSWCLADVIKMHGESGLRTRQDEWMDSETVVVYPTDKPEGAESLPPGLQEAKPSRLDEPPASRLDESRPSRLDEPPAGLDEVRSEPGNQGPVLRLPVADEEPTTRGASVAPRAPTPARPAAAVRPADAGPRADSRRRVAGDGTEKSAAPSQW